MNLCMCGCGAEIAEGRRYFPSHHLPRRRDGICLNGHDTKIVGTQKSGYCKQCAHDAYLRSKPADAEEYRRIARERSRKYHANMTPERRLRYLELQRQTNKKFGDRHRDKLKRRQQWYRQNRRPERREAMKNRDLLRAYGITLAQYREMLVSQGGACAICKGPQLHQQRHAKYFDVDHDHQTGKVRGLLCNRCNKILGTAGDDVALLVASARYLAARSDTIEILEVGGSRA